MVRAIEREDEWAFMERVGDGFRPDRERLRADLRDRFLEVDGARVLVVVDRVIVGDGGGPGDLAEVSFHWDGEWRLVATADFERRAGRALWILRRDPADGRWRLLEARGDDLF